MSLFQEQLEHAEVSTALRYLGQYYFKNKLYDEASLCAQRCCDYNDVSLLVLSYCQLMRCHETVQTGTLFSGSRRRKSPVEADLTS